MSKDPLTTAAIAFSGAVFGAAVVFALYSKKAKDDLAELEKKLEASAESAIRKSASMLVKSEKVFPAVKTPSKQKRILVTGGAGFVGSNLVDALMMQGHIVYVMDNLFTGKRKNIEHWMDHPNFQFFQHDVTNPFFIEVDQIYHLACPASPPHYQYNPIKTIKTSMLGTLNMLGLAKRVRARLLFTSTSEIYGDPEVHPQTEDYWGHVNCIGPRACYDEGKRVGETLCYEYRKLGVSVRVARIFNTFGPRMDPDDGRVVSNFIKQALNGNDLTIYGDGKQTRSFQYVSDLIQGLLALMNCDSIDDVKDAVVPVNLGNPEEYTINEFAESIRASVNPSAKIIYYPATADDPKQRRPNNSRAAKLLHWAPKTRVSDGIAKTVLYFKHELGLAAGSDAAAPVVWMPEVVDRLPASYAKSE